MSETPLIQAIRKLARGPSGSENLSFEEAYAAMKQILRGEFDEVQAAIFFMALRMKGESLDECTALLEANIEEVTHIETSRDFLIDISDPYDGWTRTLPLTPFLLPLLAALNLPAVSHGVERLAPKFGITHRQVLKATGIPVDLTLEEAREQLEALGWAYVDQAQFAPKLYGLANLRARMVKRVILAAIEGYLTPLRARRMWKVSGFTHKGFAPIYAFLAQKAGFERLLLVRGIEGSTLPSLEKEVTLFRAKEGEIISKFTVSPKDVGLDLHSGDIHMEGLSPEEILKKTVQLGTEALKGIENSVFKALAYLAGIYLLWLDLVPSLLVGYERARLALSSGIAWQYFEAAMQR